MRAHQLLNAIDPSLRTYPIHLNEWTETRGALIELKELCDYYGNMLNLEIHMIGKVNPRTFKAIIKELEQRDIGFNIVVGTKEVEP